MEKKVGTPCYDEKQWELLHSCPSPDARNVHSNLLYDYRCPGFSSKAITGFGMLKHARVCKQSFPSAEFLEGEVNMAQCHNSLVSQCDST